MNTCEKCGEKVAVFPGQENKPCPYCGGKMIKNADRLKPTDVQSEVNSKKNAVKVFEVTIKAKGYSYEENKTVSYGTCKYYIRSNSSSQAKQKAEDMHFSMMRDDKIESNSIEATATVKEIDEKKVPADEEIA